MRRCKALALALLICVACTKDGNRVDAHKDVIPVMLDNAPPAPPEDSPLLVVATSEVKLGDAVIGRVADVPSKGDWAALTSALAGKKELRVLAHQSVKFPVLATIVATAHRAGARVSLLGRDSHGKTSAVTLETSTTSLASAGRVVELHDGFMVFTKAGRVGPGCKEIGVGVTVRRHMFEGHELPDYDALASCVMELHAAPKEPKLGDTIIVGEQDEGTVSDLYAMIGAILRQTGLKIALALPS